MGMLRSCPNCKRDFYPPTEGAYCPECWRAWMRNNGTFEYRECSTPMRYEEREKRGDFDLAEQENGK